MNEDYDKEFVRDHIIALVHADHKPVYGKTLFIIQLFLVFKVVSPETFVPFFPYLFGPYSTAVAIEVNWLIDQKYMEISKEGRKFVITVTDRGKEMAEKVDISQEKVMQIARVKRNAHELGLKKMTAFLHNNYPQYMKDSRT